MFDRSRRLLKILPNQLRSLHELEHRRRRFLTGRRSIRELSPYDVIGAGLSTERRDSGWGSYWPRWAFELARAALLRGKKVLVIYDSDPKDDNFTDVLLDAG
jgi:hypothetical protein